MLLAFLQDFDHRNNQLMLLTGALLVLKHHKPKQIVSTLKVELGRPLKVKVDEVRLLLRHLNGYNSVCFLKPVTPLKLPGRLNLVRISCCYENTPHLTQTKGRSLDKTEAPPLRE